MSSFKHLGIVVCLLCTALPAHAEKPNDNRTANDDSRSNGSMQQTDSGYTKEWGGKNIHEWIRDLRFHSDPTCRVEAILAIPNFKQAADAVPEMLKQLKSDGDASVRVKAAQLMRLMPHHKVDRTRIITGLAYSLHHDPQSIIRYEAAVSLQSYCPLDFSNKDEVGVLQDLVAGLNQTTTYELREACVLALMSAGVDPKTGPDPKVTDALITRANPTYEAATRVRVQAIVALGVQGRPQDKNKFDKVMGVLTMAANYNSRTNPIVRIWAHVSVIALQVQQKDNKKELDTIAEYLTHKEAVNRREAVRALGALEEKSQAYVDNILTLLKREDIPAVKEEAAMALGRMKNTGARVIGALVRLSEEDKPESWPIVRNVCLAFLMLGVNNGEVMKALDKVVEHKSLQKYQKDWVKKVIEEIQNPRKKAKDAPKNSEKAIAPKKDKKR
ncbi:MAG TPA: HEAT repeat domain-containing protein [Gemmataceae bacterium]|nr:HEAT repeat domain-containing protein [Gemmataceae bacterium]